MTAVGAFSESIPAFVARWDLDKTYLRTDFDTVRDLLRTALERPDQKRTVPGAAALLRELGKAGGEIHILSGSPEQLRGKIVDKLRLDGARWASLTLKPNLQNLLRLRFRDVRGQLGYKLPALLRKKAELTTQSTAPRAPLPEILLGDDAEADAFVYSLYADLCAGLIPQAQLETLLRAGGCYDDTIEDALRLARSMAPGPTVRRILIHLDRQSAPGDFAIYGPRVCPFYNYLQAAFMLHEDGLLPASAPLRVAQELVSVHNFEASALGRSYADMVRRGCYQAVRVPELQAAYEALTGQGRSRLSTEVGAMVAELGRVCWEELLPPPASAEAGPIDYGQLVLAHNPRR